MTTGGKNFVVVAILLFITTLAILAAIWTLIKLIRSRSKITERFGSKGLSGLIQDAEDGKDPNQMAGEIAKENKMLAATPDDTSHEYDDAALDSIQKAIANQEREMKSAEALYYGVAKHVRSGELMQAKNVLGQNIGGANTGFWVNAADTSKNVYAALEYEDKFGADGGFSREYALWKCSKTSGCKGAVIARDGSRFGLFKRFIAPSVSYVQNTQTAKAGARSTWRGDDSATTQARNVDGHPEYPLNKDFLADDYDLWIEDSEERAAVQAQEDSLRGAWSGKQGNKKLVAEEKADVECQGANTALDWNNFSCVITECVDRGKKIEQSDGKKRWKSNWDCYGKPKSKL